MSLPNALTDYPALTRIGSAVLSYWPEHESFLTLRFADAAEASLPVAEEMAAIVLRIVGNELPLFVANYRWTCEKLREEDLHFRRTGSYRWSKFEDAYREVYSNVSYMQKYLQGLLLSQVLWANQAAAFDFYVKRFLFRLKPSADYLEIGPGHGLLIYFAAQSLSGGTITGWDVSESSLAMTRQTLDAIGVERGYSLNLHSIFDRPMMLQAFDAVVVSEVLEHLECPEGALDTVREVLRPGGLAFFNVPVNSPAPDHIYHWSCPLEVESLVLSRGFTIVDSSAAPATGYDLDRARRRKATINSLIVAVRP